MAERSRDSSVCRHLVPGLRPLSTSDAPPFTGFSKKLLQETHTKDSYSSSSLCSPRPHRDSMLSLASWVLGQRDERHPVDPATETEMGNGMVRANPAAVQKRVIAVPSQAPRSVKRLTWRAPQMNVSAGTIWHLKNGKYLHSIFPYKSGSSEWLRLQVLALSGKWIEDPHWPPWTRMVQSVVRYTPATVASAAGELLRILIVRSPYERMLSAYIDKVVNQPPTWNRYQLQLVPRGMKRNGSFAEFVRLAMAERTPRSEIGAAHYGPLTRWWREPSCTVAQKHATSNDCWLGFPNTTRILKLDRVGTWYADTIRTLGWEVEVSDGRWEGGCFYRPHGTTCDTALSSPGNGTPAKICVRGSHGGHQHKTCTSMAEHYTPEVAGAVTAYVRDDLVRFGYSVWHGDVTQPWQ